MEKIVSTFEFLQDSSRWNGAVEVLEVTESNNKHIYLRIRIGNHTLRLPRSRLKSVITALTLADTDAKRRYTELIRNMNQGSRK